MTTFHHLALSLLIALDGAAAQAASAEASIAAAAAEASIAAAAAETRDRCYPLMHHDSFEYQDCVFALLGSEPRPTARRLGIEYFGWVGAVASQRSAMVGADETAAQFLWRFRQTQRSLKIDDQRLCATVEGNCGVRIAQMKQAEAAAGGKAPAPPLQHEAEPRTPERH